MSVHTMICNLRAAATLIISFATIVVNSTVAPAALVVDISTRVNGIGAFSGFTTGAVNLTGGNSLLVGDFVDVQFRVTVDPLESGGGFLNSYGLQFNLSNPTPISSVFAVQSQLYTASNTANSVKGSGGGSGLLNVNEPANAIFATVRFTAAAVGSTTLTFVDPLPGALPGGDGGLTFSTSTAANGGTISGRDGDTFPIGPTIDVTVAVPEPGSILLIGSTLAGLGIKRFRRSLRVKTSV